MLNFESTAVILSTYRRQMGGTRSTHGDRSVYNIEMGHARTGGDVYMVQLLQNGHTGGPLNEPRSFLRRYATFSFSETVLHRVTCLCKPPCILVI
jgi:hypothetical protein